MATHEPTSNVGNANELDGAAACFTTVGLDELNTLASLQIRHDRKYILTVNEAADYLRWLGNTGAVRVLEVAGERSSRYDSTYFDSPALDCYRMAVQRNRHRFKVRTRTYVSSNQSFLEVKTKSASGHTVKNRIPWNEAHSLAGDPAGEEFINDCLPAHVRAAELGLIPTQRTQYRRTTLHLSGPNIRLTLDQDLRWSSPDGSFAGTSNRVIVETKSAGHPSFADRRLWALGHRPLPSSKYAAGIALMYPEIPRERWHRTIGRHLQPVILPASSFSYSSALSSSTPDF